MLSSTPAFVRRFRILWGIPSNNIYLKICVCVCIIIKIKFLTPPMRYCIDRSAGALWDPVGQSMLYFICSPSVEFF